ncbi:MAG TPA: lysophospholipid acyltransferase family protein [Novosphingobium sp.]|nr:lysophospholipid acyltransferase family protein [Novosphingobium sp.]
MHVLRSLAFYFAFYVGGAFLIAFAGLMMFAPRPAFRWAVDTWSGYHRLCARLFLGIRVRVEGAMPTGPVLIAIKHESFFEAIDLPHLLDYPGVFAKAELMSIPVWGLAGRRYGLVEVHREQGAKALRQMLAAARALSDAGRPLAIFPEGTRVPHGEQRELKSGFAGVYKLLGLPVVAVAVNSGPLYHRWWKCSGTLTYRFSEPIPPGLPRDEAEARVIAAINALNHE